MVYVVAAANQNSSFDSFLLPNSYLLVVGVTLLVQEAAWMGRAALACSTSLQPDFATIQIVLYRPNCLARLHIEVVVPLNMFEHLE